MRVDFSIPSLRDAGSLSGYYRNTARVMSDAQADFADTSSEIASGILGDPDHDPYATRHDRYKASALMALLYTIFEYITKKTKVELNRDKDSFATALAAA